MEDDPTKNGLSYKVKIPIILLTLITLGAMGVLFIKIAFSVNSSEKQLDSYQYLRNVGDKLKDKGLHEQAIDQYIKYLEKTKINTPSRAMETHPDKSNNKKSKLFNKIEEYYKEKGINLDELKNTD